jgi:hypothetical protein
MNQYFMYGILVSHKTYLQLNTLHTIEDVLKGDDGIQGIFTGRNGNFMIIGTVLDSIENDGKPQIVPELETAEESLIRVSVEEKYGITGDFHYYFIKN